MNRRELLKGCTDFVKSMYQEEEIHYSLDQNGTSDEILVVIFLRGGYDGLNFLAPVDDKNYISARGEDLRITDQNKNKGLAIEQNFLDADFRLHKYAKPIKELYDDKKLAFVHASGLSNGTRSHFVAQQLIEKGTLKEKNLRDGWLTRYLDGEQSEQLSAYAVGNNQPESLLAARQVLSLNRIEDLKIGWGNELKNLMRNSYLGTSFINQQGTSAMDIQKFLDEKSSNENLHKAENIKKKINQSKGKRDGKFVNNLNTLETIIKMEVGLKVGTINYGGWDTHDGQQGRYEPKIQDLCQSLAQFYNRLHNYHSRLNIVVMSEFGRRVKANNNGGTDHGYGNVMWALGGNVNGGNIYGKWPGLANDQLNKKVDLEITTDYRTVLAELMQKRMKRKDIANIFPKFNYKKSLGIFNA